MFNPGNYLARFDLARLRPYGMASIVLFALGALGGGLAVIFYPETASHLQDLLKQFAKMFQGMPKLKLATSILVPVIFLIVNGAILGAVIPVAIESKGLWHSIMTIVPHGIFELPAIFLGTSIGLKLGWHPFRRLAGKADRTFLSELGHGLRLFFSVILPLLLVAAAIEVFVTPLIAGL